MCINSVQLDKCVFDEGYISCMRNWVNLFFFKSSLLTVLMKLLCATLSRNESRPIEDYRETKLIGVSRTRTRDFQIETPLCYLFDHCCNYLTNSKVRQDFIYNGWRISSKNKRRRGGMDYG